MTHYFFHTDKLHIMPHCLGDYRHTICMFWTRWYENSYQLVT